MLYDNLIWQLNWSQLELRNCDYCRQAACEGVVKSGLDDSKVLVEELKGTGAT